MKVKGFTLIELLGVIIIISVLALLVYPVVINLIKGSSEKTDNLTMDLINNATDLYIKSNTDKFQKVEENSYCITLQELVEDGYIKSPITFSESDEDVTTKKSVQVRYNNGFNYELKNNEDCIEKIIYVDKSGANAPELMNNTLIPVIYDIDHWEVADTNKEWYNYYEQEWANAVILNDGVSTTPGTTIYPDGENLNIKAMFVWIPRYEYKIEGTYGKDGTDAKNPGEIEINFIDKDTTRATAGYTLHPAFDFGGEQLSGIWVGKFETSHTGGGTKSLTCTNENCSDADSLRILPNVVSLRSNPVSKFFFASRSMTREENPFKLDSSTTDSHMMKNSEWGAVAYLSQSKYGKYGNSAYEGTNKEVYKNNSSNYYTGRSGGAPGGSIAQVKDQYPDSSSTSTSEYYNYGYYTYDGYKVNYDGSISTERDINKGTGASTTGNITGVYDMSGGAYEYVMGYLTTAYTTDSSKNLPWGSTSSANYARFTQAPESKYYDEYTDSDKNNEAYKGQALGETSGWYSDSAHFVSTSYPWFSRGGYYLNSSYAGVFYFDHSNGNGFSDNSFRVVLAPTT